MFSFPDEVPYILVSNRYYIRNITIDGSNVYLHAQNLNRAVALDFDWKEKRIYWSDITTSNSNISRMFLNGSDSKVLHRSTLRNPDGLAVDWIGRNLYWCDKTTDTIEVSKLDGSLRRVLWNRDLEEPRALVVHPLKGWLFYSDWGDNAHIARLGMDGKTWQKIITKELVMWPNGLTVDFITDHIFWADARLDYIAYANLDGSGIQYVIRGGLPHIFALTTYEDYIYWTDWENKSVERAHKFTGRNKTKILSMVHRPMDLQVYHQSRQLVQLKEGQENPCTNCSENMLCLIRPGGRSAVCECPEKHIKSIDKTMCLANCSTYA
jgi:integrin beta 2